MLVHRASRLEDLVDVLATRLSQPLSALSGDDGLASILHPDVVMIQSAGMERYLSRELARRNGGAANLQFPYPRSWFRGVMTAALQLSPDEVALSDRYERESTTWAIHRLLGEFENDSSVEMISSWWRPDKSGLRRYQIAKRLSDLFDQYCTSRPDWILAWQQKASPEEPQTLIFHQLMKEFGPWHLPELSRRFLQKTADEDIRAVVKGRVSLVGGAGLPPLFLRLLQRISQALPAELFSLLVSESYFGDSVRQELDEEEGVHHRLLTALGKVGADFQQVMEDLNYRELSHLVKAPGETTLLRALQSDILQGSPRPKQQLLPPEILLDQTITIDSCHSPLRELEVLKNRILGWFDEDPELCAEDIVVLAPAMETYAPLIPVAFGEIGEEKTIPWRIADRSEVSLNQVAAALLKVIRFSAGRARALDFLDLLQMKPIQERFQFTNEEVAQIRDWVHQAHLIWGADAQEWLEHEVENGDLYSLRGGLDRLLLSLAFSKDDGGSFGAVVPAGGVSSQELELLGRFGDFLEALLKFRSLSRPGDSPHPIPWWKSLFSELFETLFAEDPEGSWDLAGLRFQLFRILEQAQREGGEELQISLKTLERIFENDLNQAKFGTSFLSGGITFCSLLPLRTIPFPRVCVLGLGHAEFPRSDQPHGLDLISREPRPGDRSLRDDDRYLILELLLATRERIAFSYIGQNIHDNTELPPSVILEELRRTLQTMVVGSPALGSDGVAPSENRALLPITRQPLSPFSRRAFEKGSPCRSWVRSAYRVAAALELAESSAYYQESTAPFYDFQALLPRTEEEEPGYRVTLDAGDLLQFWRDPAGYWLRGLRIQKQRELELLSQREPFSLTGLDKYQLADQLLKQLRQSGAVDDAALRDGRLPPGELGVLSYERTRRETQAVADLAQKFCPELWQKGAHSALYDWSIELPWGSLRGRSYEPIGGKQLIVGVSKLRPAKLLSGLLQHVMASLDFKVTTYLIGKEKDEPQAFVFQPMERKHAIHVLQLMTLPLFAGAQLPFPFSAEEAEKHAEHWHRKKSKKNGEAAEEIIQKARENWRPLSDSSSVSSSERLVYRDSLPLESCLEEARSAQGGAGHDSLLRDLLDETQIEYQVAESDRLPDGSWSLRERLFHSYSLYISSLLDELMGELEA
ncbi:MAG: exodeoxyribonuclease V subunit gamma [Polyangiaceae bacterium]|nr:exodeoxyribonuclease V subunit gamma [Polyangiaceae bacterium]